MLLFPVFWGMGSLANPALARAAEANPVIVSGPECSTDPFAELFGRKQSRCGQILETLTASGVRYQVVEGGTVGLTVRGAAVPLAEEWFADGEARRDGVQQALSAAGFDFSRQSPPLLNILGILALLLVLGGLSALTYGTVAALLSEMFPPRIRYSSMSIPYHIGAGYLGGFLPLISGFIVARTGDVYAGLWYTWAVVAFGVLVAIWGLPSGPPRDFADETS
jgi:hypothetical protein